MNRKTVKLLNVYATVMKQDMKQVKKQYNKLSLKDIIYILSQAKLAREQIQSTKQKARLEYQKSLLGKKENKNEI